MIRGLLGVLLILLAIHVGYIFASPTIKNTMLQGKMEDLVQNRGLKGERELHRDIMEFIDEKDIPISDKDLVIRVTDDEASIAAHYTCTASFWFYSRDYEFYPASKPSAKLKPRYRHQTAGRRTVRAGN